MSNKPHSRQKRVSGNSSFVSKNPFSSSNNQSRSMPHARQERVSSGSSFVHKQDFNSSNVRKDNGFFQTGTNNLYSTNNNIRRSKFSLKNILLLIVVFIILSFLFRNLFSSSDESSYVDNNHENYTSSTTSNNHFIENHATAYNTNTSSNNVNYNVSSNARNKFTKIIGNNQDKVTLMIYMIGTDLESQSAAGTYDINEMLKADLDDNINIILQTGGCKKWQNNVVSSKSIERYQISSRGFNKIDTLTSEPMVEEEVLSSFIKYCANNYPANRYMLILWDHGGGSVTGFGYDEKYPSAGSMSPDEIAEALKDSGVKFDFVGFDACLMANLETAIAIEPYADYLIGSEETEPGGGWYYTNWLTTLDRSPSISTVDLGKMIIDDYISSSLKSYRNVEVTQSIVDLGELVANIKKPLADFSNATSVKLQSDEYQVIANARGKTKEFSKSSKLDQVDLVDLADNFNVEGSKELIEAIKSSVKYNRAQNISDAYGLSAYFPYSSLSKMNEMVKIYDNINMDEPYTDVIKSFATFASSGQIVTQNSGSGSIFDMLMGSDYSSNSLSNDGIYSLLSDALFSSNYSSNGYDYYGYGNEAGYGSFSSILGGDDWVDSSALDYVSLFLGRDHIVDSSSLNVVEKNGHNVVSLTDSQWDLIDSVLLNVLVDDGQGYIDMGMDNIFEWDNQGNLIVESDGTWLSINDHFVPYYMVSDEYIDDNNYKTVGRIPAYLNGQKVDIMVSFTPENPYGIIEGAKPIYEESDIQQKGLIDIKDGDVIKFICNYYTYDNKFVDEFQMGEDYIVDGPMELYNTTIENDYIYSYCFKDIYGNMLWTPKSSK